ncbi:MAG TPA: hypothetical protein VMJ90_02630 [Anaerolineales bacterium]|nr:hypothetical protein [Anaerolineales bacterium]
MMTNLDTRIERAKKEISGNESLLDMLEVEAATEMFNWGQSLAESIASDTSGIDDAAAEDATAPRLKALRQALRSIGNWAVGKYSDPADRTALKEKLPEQMRLILGDKSNDLSIGELDKIIDSVDAQGQTPHQLILKMKELIEKTG